MATAAEKAQAVAALTDLKLLAPEVSEALFQLHGYIYSTSIPWKFEENRTHGFINTAVARLRTAELAAPVALAIVSAATTTG